MACGTVDAAGIAFAQYHVGWDATILVDLMTHEEIHLWWRADVSEAPSLL